MVFATYHRMRAKGESWAGKSPMYAYPTFQNERSSGVAMGSTHHSDGDPAPDIATCLIVGMILLRNKEVGQSFQCGLSLDA